MARLHFMGIENIHVMRGSLRTFLQLLQPRGIAGRDNSPSKEEDSFLSDLDKWVEH